MEHFIFELIKKFWVNRLDRWPCCCSRCKFRICTKHTHLTFCCIHRVWLVQATHFSLQIPHKHTHTHMTRVCSLHLSRFAFAPNFIWHLIIARAVIIIGRWSVGRFPRSNTFLSTVLHIFSVYFIYFFIYTHTYVTPYPYKYNFCMTRAWDEIRCSINIFVLWRVRVFLTFACVNIIYTYDAVYFTTHTHTHTLQSYTCNRRG